MALKKHLYTHQNDRRVRIKDIVHYNVEEFLKKPATIHESEGETTYWELEDGRRVSGYAELVTIDGKQHLKDMFMRCNRALGMQDSFEIGEDLSEDVLDNLEYMANTRDYIKITDIKPKFAMGRKLNHEYALEDCVIVPEQGDFMSFSDRWVRKDARPIYEATKIQTMFDVVNSADKIAYSLDVMLDSIESFSDIEEIITEEEIAAINSLRNTVKNLGTRSSELRKRVSREVHEKVHGPENPANF